MSIFVERVRDVHTKHDQPLRVLHTVLVLLRVTEGGNLDAVGFIDFFLGPVTNEDGLATPLDDNLLSTRGLISIYPKKHNAISATYVLALRDRTKADFDLGLGQDIRRGGHVNQEVCIGIVKSACCL